MESWRIFQYIWQYFLPFATKGINQQIEQGILSADRMGVKVLSLAALNKVWNYNCKARNSFIRCETYFLASEDSCWNFCPLFVQNEALNGGGVLFVKKHPNLRVRVVHGNTLTAAVTINQIPKDVKEVFLTGATSKLGRAIALYLCRKHVRVLVRVMLSFSKFWTGTNLGQAKP